jgi:4,5-dihydroxyphthalate decarboxylase
MPKLQLSIALGDYDHVRDVLTGEVPVEGVELVVARRAPVEEIFHRFTNFREWDVSEMSFAKYVSLVSQPGCDLVAIPVFPSRAFRHSSIYVREDGGLRDPAALAGRRIGLPEWAQTASVYTRGLLAHEYGVDLASVEWIQAGVNEAGRKEKVALKLPAGVRLRPDPAHSLSDLLARGELDAVLSARAPAAFLQAGSGVRRLFDDPREAERAYHRRTGIFPIMHVVALRRAVLEAHPWVAMNLLQAFEAAKQRSLRRMADVTASPVPLPWVASYAEQSRAMFGDDFWPYGVEPNRRTLEAFLLYAWEQGVAHRHLQPEELFPASCLASVKV